MSFIIKAKWTIRDAFTVVLGIACLILGLNIALYFLDIQDFFSQSQYKSLITLILFSVQEVVFIAPLYFLVIKKYALKSHDLGFAPLKWTTALKWISKGFGVVILFNIFFALITYRLGMDIPGFGPQSSHIPLFGDKSAFDFALAVLILLIIAPIVEEMLFRGFLLQTFLAKSKPWVASLATALMFAVVHFEFQSIAIIIFLGLVLNWIFMRTKSLWPCIGFHMLNNALAFLLEWLIWSGNIPS